MVRHILFVWLPLFVGVLLLLSAYAALLGPNPRQYHVTGESKLLERSASSRKAVVSTVLIVALALSLILAFAVSGWKLAVPHWLMYIIYGVAALQGAFIAASMLSLLLHHFDSRAAKVSVAVYAVAVSVTWWLWPNWLTVDLLAALAMFIFISLYMQFTLNFKVAAVIGGGFLLYDVLNVYFTGNMARLAGIVIGAKQQQGSRPLPFAVLVPERLSLDAGWVASLGLGDIVFPGLLIVLAAVLAYRHNAMEVLYGGLLGYAVGLVVVMAIKSITQHGQPALITLYPGVLIGILAAARRAGLLHELFAMRHPPFKPAQKPGHVHGRDCNCDCGVN